MSSSIVPTGTSQIEFTTVAGSEAIARSTVTTTNRLETVSFVFEVHFRPLVLRVGSTAGGNEIFLDAAFGPGVHVISFIPDVNTYYMEFRLPQIGAAKITGFKRIAAGDFELDTPWAESDLTSLRHEQSLNVQWWTVSTHKTRVLERRNSTNWSLRHFQPANGPFGPLNLSDVTMTASARTGTATVTASRPLFSTVDAGSLIRLTHAGQFETETFSGVDQVTEAIRISGIENERVFTYSITGSFTASIVLERSVGNEFNYVAVQTFTGAASGSYDDDLDNQVIYYRLRSSAYTSGSPTVSLTYAGGVTDGVGIIRTVDADNAVTVDILEPFAKTTATSLWNLGAWSGRRGYPSAVTLHDGRLYFARGNAYYGSQPDNFESFEVTALADGAISRTFPGRMSSCRWLASGEELYAGLTGREDVIGSNAFDELITPSNVRARPRTRRGSANTAHAELDDGLAFVTRSKERIMSLVYDGNRTAAASDLTRLNRDIGGTGFKEIAYQHEPEPRLWCVREDGQVAVLSYDPAESVVAWWRIVMDGAVESVCSVPDTPEDAIYFLVKRTIDGVERRYVEKLASEAWATSSQAWHLHSALSYSGTSTSTLTGLGHLEGRSDVYVWGNGRQQGPFTVSSGSITLTEPVTYAIAGLKYDGKYKGPRLNWGGSMGASLTLNKQVSDLGLIISDTAGGCLAWGPSFDNARMMRLPDRQPGDSYDNPISLVNEDRSDPFEGETSRDPRLHILMDKAGPAKVQALVPLVDTNG